MQRSLVACAVMLALVACGRKEDLNGDGIVDGVRDPNSISQVAPSKPVGTISGSVVDAQGTAIEGVTVTMVLGDGASGNHTYTTQTIADGTYAFKDVPGGSAAQLLLTKTGYSAASLNGAIPGTTGNFPLNDGNGNAGVVTLTQLNSTLRVRVYTALGKGAKGAKAYLEVEDAAFQSFGGGYGQPCGHASAAADVDDNGLLVFTNLPSLAELTRIDSSIRIRLTIGALDDTGDGRVDYLGTLQTYLAGELFTQPERTIVLNEARTAQPLSILATNLDSFEQSFTPPYRNAVKATEPINIVFNQPITQADTTRVIRVVEEDCQTNVAIIVTQRSANVLSIAPSTAWTLGNRYNLSVRVTGLDSGDTKPFIGYFFALDATAPKALGATALFTARKAPGNTRTNALQPNDALYAVFDTPVGYQGGPQARALVNFDLNNDGLTGGAAGAGEFNGPADSGFILANAEQTTANDPSQGSFTCKESGYSRRWAFSVTFPTSGFIPANTGMRAVFSGAQSSAATFQTAWGAPVAGEFNGALTIVP